MNETDVRHLRDRADIHDLIVRLAHAQDDRDWHALGDCYLPGAVYVHPGGSLTGVDAIIDRTRIALTPLDASQHLLGSILVTVEDDQASAVTYFQAQHVRHDTSGGDLYVIAGTYRDRLVRSAHRWQIAHRTQDYTWRDGNPEVTRRAGPDARAART